MSNEQIKYMVNRFLMWRLPENFNPDCGISFKQMYNEGTPYPAKHEPVGTNLFDATQAEEMVRYMVDGVPAVAERGDGHLHIIITLNELKERDIAKIAEQNAHISTEEIERDIEDTERGIVAMEREVEHLEQTRSGIAERREFVAKLKKILEYRQVRP